MNRLQRSIRVPIRTSPTYDESWNGPDRGLFGCWERGRKLRIEDPELAQRADSGELVILVWRGGVETKQKSGIRTGSLQYLAMWQGLRGDDLDVVVDGTRELVCSRFGQAVSFQRDSRSAEEANRSESK